MLKESKIIREIIILTMTSLLLTSKIANAKTDHEINLTCTMFPVEAVKSTTDKRQVKSMHVIKIVNRTNKNQSYHIVEKSQVEYGGYWSTINANEKDIVLKPNESATFQDNLVKDLLFTHSENSKTQSYTGIKQGSTTLKYCTGPSYIKIY